MIRPLRRRHLWLVALVAALAGVLLALALAVRPEPPLQDRFPERLEAAPR